MENDNSLPVIITLSSPPISPITPAPLRKTLNKFSSSLQLPSVLRLQDLDSDSPSIYQYIQSNVNTNISTFSSPLVASRNKNTDSIGTKSFDGFKINYFDVFSNELNDKELYRIHCKYYRGDYHIVITEQRIIFLEAKESHSVSVCYNEISDIISKKKIDNKCELFIYHSKGYKIVMNSYQSNSNKENIIYCKWIDYIISQTLNQSEIIVNVENENEILDNYYNQTIEELEKSIASKNSKQLCNAIKIISEDILKFMGLKRKVIDSKTMLGKIFDIYSKALHTKYKRSFTQRVSSDWFNDNSEIGEKESTTIVTLYEEILLEIKTAAKDRLIVMHHILIFLVCMLFGCEANSNTLSIFLTGGSSLSIDSWMKMLSCKQYQEVCKCLNIKEMDIDFRDEMELEAVQNRIIEMKSTKYASDLTKFYSSALADLRFPTIQNNTPTISQKPHTTSILRKKRPQSNIADILIHPLIKLSEYFYNLDNEDDEVSKTCRSILDLQIILLSQFSTCIYANNSDARINLGDLILSQDTGVKFLETIIFRICTLLDDFLSSHDVNSHLLDRSVNIRQQLNSSSSHNFEMSGINMSFTGSAIGSFQNTLIPNDDITWKYHNIPLSTEKLIFDRYRYAQTESRQFSILEGYSIGFDLNEYLQENHFEVQEILLYYSINLLRNISQESSNVRIYLKGHLLNYIQSIFTIFETICPSNVIRKDPNNEFITLDFKFSNKPLYNLSESSWKIMCITKRNLEAIEEIFK